MRDTIALAAPRASASAVGGAEGTFPAAVDSRDRRQLRLLDACLHQLEDLHERDQTKLSAGVAAGLRRYVPAVREGMLIAEAIEQVFKEQEWHLRVLALADRSGSCPSAVPPPPRLLDEAGARSLTNRIKSATCQVCQLLLEAHEGRAWSALGYHSWEQYVHREFALSRSRSYELLDQGRVIRAVGAAARVSGIPDISAYAASQVKPCLAEVTSAIRERTAGLSEERAMAVIDEVIQETRSRSRPRLVLEDRADDGGSGACQVAAAADLSRLAEIVEYLASLPPVTEVLDQAPARVLGDGASVERAARWLAELADVCVAAPTARSSNGQGWTGRPEGRSVKSRRPFAATRPTILRNAEGLAPTPREGASPPWRDLSRGCEEA